MKTIALLICASLGAATGCAAGVETGTAYRTGPGPAYRGPERVSTRWVTLADHYSGESNRQFITVNSGGFRRIRVEAVRGTPVIQQVKIEFNDVPDMQTVKMDARLTPGQGQTISLNGRDVKRVIVYTDPSYGGAYSVFGG